MLEVIKNDLLSFLGATSIAGLFITFLIRFGIQSGFAKALQKNKSNLDKINDEYRTKLNKEIEELKHNQQKLLKDFDLYTSKKHEKYPELYYQVEEAYGQIFSLRGLGYSFTFENVNEVDLSIYFEEEKMTNYDKERLLAEWRQDKFIAIEKIRELVKKLRFTQARQSWTDANNYFISNSLYFSQTVHIQTEDLFKNLYKYLNNLEPGLSLSPEMTQENTKYRNEILPEKRKNLKIQMRKELSNEE
ncbi:hypothetical protein [Metabacillus idriensis]|uniref:hypothetical protein n=1 Tax=Metabacillus idriensis TaxID=324768 RepID=UPI003D2ABC67